MTSDEQIGRNLSAMRGDMPQKELADEMRKRDFKWSQATVWSIEKGERPLRLSEAQAVAEILTRPVEVLLAADGVEQVHAWTRAVFNAHSAIIEALAEYDEARVQLAAALDRIPHVEKRGLLRASTDWIQTPVSQALEDYRDRVAREGAANLAREGMTEEEWNALPSSNGEWMDRLNAVDEAFLRKGGINGEPQATS